MEPFLVRSSVAHDRHGDESADHRRGNAVIHETAGVTDRQVARIDDSHSHGGVAYRRRTINRVEVTADLANLFTLLQPSNRTAERHKRTRGSLPLPPCSQPQPNHRP